MSVKKVYAEVYALLSANQDATVGELMPQIEEVMQPAVADTNHRFNDAGQLEVYCYYHKEWENTTEVEYGKKASNKTTGLNTMCKVGVNCWTKQQRDAKAAKAGLLDRVASGELEADDLKAELDRIEDGRKAILPRAEYFAAKQAAAEAKATAELTE